MDLMTFLKKLFHEICQKGLKNDLSMLPMDPIIINTPYLSRQPKVSIYSSDLVYLLQTHTCKSVDLNY